MRSHCENYSSGYIRLVVVLKGESASYLGPAVLYLIKMCYGWGLWSASRLVFVSIFLFKVFAETICQIREGEDFRHTRDKTTISKELTLPVSV